MDLETFKKLWFAFNERKKEEKQKMIENLKEEMLELIRLEKAKEDAKKAFFDLFAKLQEKLVCPSCNKKVKLDFSRITCPHCGFSTGLSKSLEEMLRKWLLFSYIFKSNGELAKTIREFWSLGGEVTLNLQQEACNEEGNKED